MEPLFWINKIVLTESLTLQHLALICWVIPASFS